MLVVVIAYRRSQRATKPVESKTPQLTAEFEPEQNWLLGARLAAATALASYLRSALPPEVQP